MTASRRFLILAAILVVVGELWGAIGGGGFNQLESIEPPAAGGTDFVLRFTRRPEFVRVPLENSLVLVLDFADTVYPPIRETLQLAEGPVRTVSLTQFSRDKVRLSLKLASRGRVEIFRRQEGNIWALTMRVQLGEAGKQRPAVAPPKEGQPAAPGTAVVVLDAGHGGRDEGARGRTLREKDVTLSVTLAAKTVFDRDERLRAYVTRSTDRYINLDERQAFASRVRANVFISIHANSLKEGDANGVEVYFLSLKGASDEEARRQAERENASDFEPTATTSILDAILDDMVQVSTINQSSRLANIVMRRFTRATRQKSRGIRQAGFKVLKKIDIPSILIECGFISNPQEERRLADPDYHEAAGRALYQSVVEYLTSTGQI